MFIHQFTLLGRRRLADNASDQDRGSRGGHSPSSKRKAQPGLAFVKHSQAEERRSQVREEFAKGTIKSTSDNRTDVAQPDSCTPPKSFSTRLGRTL